MPAPRRAVQRGASKVYAIDAGRGQLDWKLQNDPRVVSMEKFNARYLKPEDIGGGPVGVAVIDVSFISLTKIIPPAAGVLAEDHLLEALIARARLEFGAQRAETFAAALELASAGPLLPSSDAEHTGVRRERLTTLVNEARREYADALLCEGRAEAAAVAARAAVAADPYREDGWSLVMRAEAAASGPAAVSTALAECTATLARIDLEPSRETVALAERLRSPEITLPR